MAQQNRVFETLAEMGLASLENRSVYSSGTRDNPELTVYRDAESGVVYIDNYYVGNDVYAEGTYRAAAAEAISKRDYEISADLKRRADAYDQYYTGKVITEFGCGDGTFLREIESRAVKVTGVELQEDYVFALEEAGITCLTSTDRIPAGSQDAVFAFHVMEHIPDPVPTLRELRGLLKQDGLVVLEVPHASDFLLSHLNCDNFKKFTLWSQHLVLHTRDSLKRLLQSAGFDAIVVEGVQRYPLSNHLTWLAEGKPGGHKTALSVLDTPELRAAYEAALRKIDATDTLVAIARNPG